jgi:serine/threonine protein kinase
LADRYELQQLVGSGGMGEVWVAFDHTLLRPVAVKLLRTDASPSEQMLEQALAEGRAVARLHHPHIVQVYDVGADDGTPYLVMELVQGETLVERLRRTGPMPMQPAAALVDKICDALAEAHAQGILHCDVKPSNILLAPGDVPKLTDFGVARWGASAGGLSAGAIGGTDDFMAPEQRDGHAEARSDLWSLAATAYQALSGQSPRAIRADALPAPVRSVLMRALESQLEDRYPTVRDFQAALAAAVRRATPETRVRVVNDSARPFPSSPQTARRLAWGAVLLAILASVLGGLIVGYGFRTQPGANPPDIAVPRMIRRSNTANSRVTLESLERQTQQYRGHSLDGSTPAQKKYEQYIKGADALDGASSNSPARTRP